MTVANRKTSTTHRNFYDIGKQESDDMLDETLSSSFCFSHDEEENNKKARTFHGPTSSESSNVKWKYICMFSALVYTVFAVSILVPSSGKLRLSSSSTTKDTTTHEVGYTRPKILYGNLHVAKTGGTSLNGIMANKFERVCGHKGYSYNAYSINERNKKKIRDANIEAIPPRPDDDDSVPFHKMHGIGYEDCDYISTEVENPQWWIDTFGDRRFHNETEQTEMQLHVPCRDPIDHLMSQCNSRGIGFDCDAKNDEEFYESIEKCFLCIGRYSHSLKDHFDVKCFDFRKQFQDYIPLMAKELQGKRFVSEPFVKRETNRKRKKAKECIWKREDLMNKARKYLLEKIEYYQFCNECMGSEHELTRNT